jgi:hypothetical protein
MIRLSVAAQSGHRAMPADALRSFKLLSALRADSPTSVQPFLEELGSESGAERDVKAGQLLAMAVRIASGQST